MVKQFVALGYVEDKGDSKSEQYAFAKIEAQFNLGRNLICCRRFEDAKAADHALASVGLIYNQARAHTNLGVAFARSCQFERAEVAFQTALKIAPGSKRIHRHLKTLYSGPLPSKPQANLHVLRLVELEQANQARKEARSPRQRAPIHWGDIPSEAERLVALNERRSPGVDITVRSGKTFTLVSGLPRSGTSLMMQMLQAGGLPAKTDGE